MKERPILFSAPMARAILDGSKTQTRRALRYQPSATPHAYRVSLDAAGKKPVIAATWISGEPEDNSCCLCPYGVPGDRLWVRETWAETEVAQDASGAKWIVYRESDTRTDYGGPWRPSIFMPRRASRITLEVTGIRVERLQDISEADAIAEGAPPSHPSIDKISREFGYADFPRSWYGQLWDSINGAGSWDANPWVWVVEFRRVPA